MNNLGSLKEIKIIKQNDRQKIILTEDVDGKKYLKRELEDDKREIYKTLQKINHPSIPKIFYVGFEDKTIVVEEYVEGTPLSEKEPLSKRRIKHIAKAVLSALETLHQANVIHRDIKPDNILMNESGQVWLVDYEIARIYRNEVRKDTEQMGTFGYAPIEQFGMLPTDFKTDIYAFGVTLNGLLEQAGIKGSLKRIADKCRRLDPSQRYKNATAVKRSILFASLRYPLIFFVALIILAVAIASSVNVEKETDLPIDTVTENKEVQQEEEEKEPDKKLETKPEEKMPALEKHEEPEQFEGGFSGFDQGEQEKIYGENGAFPGLSIFSTDTPYTHLLFLDDMNKKGKIKFGESETVINADITLNAGMLSVYLADGKGNSFSREFKYSGQFEYEKEYTDNLRKNADIICYDLDGDGDTELLIGLNECEMGAVYNGVNYCVAWCIRYDENTGFILCDGDMISRGAPFSITQHGTGLDVRWENVGDVFGYYLDGNKILTY